MTSSHLVLGAAGLLLAIGLVMVLLRLLDRGRAGRTSRPGRPASSS